MCWETPGFVTCTSCPLRRMAWGQLLLPGNQLMTPEFWVTSKTLRSEGTGSTSRPITIVHCASLDWPWVLMHLTLTLWFCMQTKQIMKWSSDFYDGMYTPITHTQRYIHITHLSHMNTTYHAPVQSFTMFASTHTCMPIHSYIRTNINTYKHAYTHLYKDIYKIQDTVSVVCGADIGFLNFFPNC